MKSRVFCRCQPMPGDSSKSLLAHAGMGEKDDLCPISFAEAPKCRLIVREHSLEWLAALPLRMLWCERMHPVEREHGLGVQRVLHLQRAVLIKSGDAVFRRHEILARRVRSNPDEIQDRGFCWPVIPRRKEMIRHLRLRPCKL